MQTYFYRDEKGGIEVKAKSKKEAVEKIRNKWMKKNGFITRNWIAERI